MEEYSKDEILLKKQLLCEINKGVQNFKDGNVKTHEEVFGKFRKPTELNSLDEEEFDKLMENSIKNYENGNCVSEKDFSEALKKEYNI